MLQVNLGHDSWANDCRAKIREGLRSRNMVDLGGIRVWRIASNVVVTDADNQISLPVPCDSEAMAIIEATRIADHLVMGYKLPEIVHIPAESIPVELLDAWIS